ncbi:hypothetical protein NEAUS04_2800, partial [Nematocida ausubeli]
AHVNSYIDEIYSIDTLMLMYKPYTTRCIVSEPIRGTEEKRRPVSQTPRILNRKALGYETEEFADHLEYKENLVR